MGKLPFFFLYKCGKVDHKKSGYVMLDMTQQKNADVAVFNNNTNIGLI